MLFSRQTERSHKARTEVTLQSPNWESHSLKPEEKEEDMNKNEKGSHKS